MACAEPPSNMVIIPPMDGGGDVRSDRIVPLPIADAAGMDVNRLDDILTSDDLPCAVAGISATLRFYDTRISGTYTTRFTIAPPRVFRAEQSLTSNPTPVAMCETELPSCRVSERVDVDEIDAVLQSPEVRDAFDRARSGAVIYGRDPRPSGNGFAIERNGALVLIGDPCAMCTAVPLDVERLAGLLRGARDQQLLSTQCVTIR
jgi:hypothetical protein